MGDLLLVDDDPALLDVMAAMLSAEGYSVRTAANGCDGLRCVAERLPDLVMLDVEMPMLDGPGMVRAMHEQDGGAEDVPVLLTSGVADLCRIAHEVGTPYYLSKVFDPDDLLRLLVRALRERRPPLAA